MIASDAAASVRHVGRVSTGVRAWLRMSGAGGLSFLGACLFAAAASAGSDAPRTETFTGFKASDNYSSGYVGGSYALSKTGLYEPGFRLRAVGAYGRYHYGGTLPGDDGEVPVTFDGEDAFLSALVGYQFRPGRLIVKLFAGIEAEDQHIVPHDPHNSVQGREWASGCRPRPGSTSRPAFFSPPTPAYGTAFQEYCSLARLGLRVRPRLSLGLEGGALGNEEYDQGAPAASCGSISAIPKSRSPAALPATISKTPRVAMSLSASIERSEIRNCQVRANFQAKARCTAGPAPAVLGLIACAP